MQKLKVSLSMDFPKMSIDKLKAATKSRLERLFASTGASTTLSDHRRVVTYTGNHTRSLIHEVRTICQPLIESDFAKVERIDGRDLTPDSLIENGAPDVSFSSFCLTIANQRAVTIQEYRFGTHHTAIGFIASIKL